MARGNGAMIRALKVQNRSLVKSVENFKGQIKAAQESYNLKQENLRKYQHEAEVKIAQNDQEITKLGGTVEPRG